MIAMQKGGSREGYFVMSKIWVFGQSLHLIQEILENENEQEEIIKSSTKLILKAKN
jgi:hypothetical protein